MHDRNKGRAELHSNDIGGFYSHIGREWTHNHTIVFCDCPNFKFSDPNWILTHELSHFILYYLGFDSKDSRNVIFTDPPKDLKDDLLESDTTIEWVKQREKNILLMVPFAENIEEKIPDDELPKSLPQWFKTRAIWWISGKITHEEFVSGMQYLFKN